MMPAWLRIAGHGSKAGACVLALAAGLTAAWAVREHIRQRVDALEAQARAPAVSRLVAAHDLPAGTRLDEAHLAVREIPVQWAMGDSLEPHEIAALEGATLAWGLARGEPLLKPYLSFAAPALSSRLEAGQRALHVPAADLGGLADDVRAGDALDIYLSFPHGDQTRTVPLLQGVRVLAVGADADGAAAGGVMLAADPQDAMRFVAARQAGSLTAMLRHRGDDATASAEASQELDAVLGLAKRKQPPARGVTVVYGDRIEAAAFPEAGGALPALPEAGP
jgi:pilus assembly protein CpaB